MFANWYYFAHTGTAIPWLVLTSMWLAQAFKETGLGQRLGYFMVACFGKSPLLIAYALVAG